MFISVTVHDIKILKIICVSTYQLRTIANEDVKKKAKTKQQQKTVQLTLFPNNEERGYKSNKNICNICMWENYKCLLKKLKNTKQVER